MSSSHFLHPLALLSILGQPLRSNPIPYTTLFRSQSRNDTQDNNRNQRGQNRQAENGRDDMRQAARQDSSRSTSRQETRQDERQESSSARTENRGGRGRGQARADKPESVNDTRQGRQPRNRDDARSEERRVGKEWRSRTERNEG